jgi:hypothetical protein
MRCRYACRSFSLKNAVPYTRCIGVPLASPFQYAFDVVSSLKPLSRFVDGTCGPRQKSTNVSLSLIV